MNKPFPLLTQFIKVAQYAEHDHRIDFKNVTIVNKIKNYCERLCLEARFNMSYLDYNFNIFLLNYLQVHVMYIVISYLIYIVIPHRP